MSKVLFYWTIQNLRKVRIMLLFNTATSTIMMEVDVAASLMLIKSNTFTPNSNLITPIESLPNSINLT